MNTTPGAAFTTPYVLNLQIGLIS